MANMAVRTGICVPGIALGACSGSGEREHSSSRGQGLLLLALHPAHVAQ